MALHPVVLCGGSGQRLWPASRPERPKQFLNLTGPRSSYQQTLLRLEGLEAARPIIVAGEAMAALALEQALEIGVSPIVLIEPQARDSAPAIAAAAAYVRAIDPDGVLLMLASDHHIQGQEAYLAAVRAVADAAAQGFIATFGVRPTGPATGYGYILPGPEVSPGVMAVAAFREKPDAETAARYLAEGYFWNSGAFAFRADVLLAEMEAFEPALVEGAQAAVRDAATDGVVVRLDAGGFSRATKISLDYAVMERTTRAVVVPAAFDWSDLGAWDAIHAACEPDADGNVAVGDVHLIDSEDCLVRSDGPMVGVIGVSGLVVIAEGGQVLVCRAQDAQKVKAMAERAKAARD